jgi:hypothetical protein
MTNEEEKEEIGMPQEIVDKSIDDWYKAVAKLEEYTKNYEVVSEDPPIFLTTKNVKMDKKDLEKLKRICCHCGLEMEENIYTLLFEDGSETTFHRIECPTEKTPDFIYR